MPGKRHSPEQILRKLREVEVALSKGETVARAVRQIAVTYRFNDSEIHVMDADGKNLTRLTNNGAQDIDPDW